VPLHRERPPAQVRQDCRCDGAVVVDGVALSQPDVRPPELIAPLNNDPLNVLALVHGENVRPGIFADVAAARGDRLVERPGAAARETSPDDWDAVIVLGGSMHPDEDDRHPWLADETQLLRGAVERGRPVLGVCLGAQLLARALGGAVFRAPQPEVGWLDVELVPAAAGDPVLGPLPRRFAALQWHEYAYSLPPGAVELARSPVCNQAFRAGAAWGVQFHPEVTAAQVAAWAAEDGASAAPALVAETAERIAAWNELGARLCGGFLDYAAGRSSRRDHSCHEPG
jgi:GMP synthase-like glutamine amidotransferase